MALALAVHGGAWNIPDADVPSHLAGIAAALRVGWSMLRDGALAVDTVERVVRLLEDDPTFNAGTGSHMNRLGHVEMDAAIMDGDLLRAGAVAAVQCVRNPVGLARRVMDHSPHVLLVGHGARLFARQQGIASCRTRDLLVGRARETYLRIRAGDTRPIESEFVTDAEAGHMGTVGAVACDAHGSLAAATSTGGTLGKVPGRVGDSPLIGVGTYADSAAGGISCTGHGESIMRVVMAKATVDRLAAGMTPEAAGACAVQDLARVQGRAGAIVVDAHGRAAAAYNTPRMARGLATDGGGLRLGVDAMLRPLDD